MNEALTVYLKVQKITEEKEHLSVSVFTAEVLENCS